jgi:hypothetical protein
MPYRILCKMQRVTSPRYRNFLHCTENFCPTDVLADPFPQDRTGTIAIESGRTTAPPPLAAALGLRLHRLLLGRRSLWPREPARPHI